MRTPALIVSCLALPLLACGETTEADRLRAADAELVAAIERRDWTVVCDHFSAAAQAEFAATGSEAGAEGCPEAMAMLEQARPGTLLSAFQDDVSTIAITGNNARAQKGEFASEYVKEHGRWKLIIGGAGSAAPTPTPARRRAPAVTVSERGFTNTGSGVSYGFLIENRSASTDAYRVDVQIELLDANGEVLETATETIDGIPAGGTFPIGGDVNRSGARVRRLRVSARAESGAETGGFALPTAAPAEIARDHRAITVRVQVHNTFAEPLSTADDIFVVLRDRDDKIVGGLAGYPAAAIAPGGREHVELVSYQRLPQAASAEAAADGFVPD